MVRYILLISSSGVSFFSQVSVAVSMSDPNDLVMDLI